MGKMWRGWYRSRRADGGNSSKQFPQCRRLIESDSYTAIAYQSSCLLIDRLMMIGSRQPARHTNKRRRSAGIYGIAKYNFMHPSSEFVFIFIFLYRFSTLTESTFWKIHLRAAFFKATSTHILKWDKTVYDFQDSFLHYRNHNDEKSGRNIDGVSTSSWGNNREK